MGSSILTTLIEVCYVLFIYMISFSVASRTYISLSVLFLRLNFQLGEIGRLSASIKKLETQKKDKDKVVYSYFLQKVIRFTFLL